MHAPIALYADAMTSGARLLCCWLWHHVVDCGEVPSVDVTARRLWLRQHLGVSRGTLDRYFRELTEFGWVQELSNPQIVGQASYHVTIRLFFSPAVRQVQREEGGS